MLIFRNKPAQGHPPSKALSLKIELYFFLFPLKVSWNRNAVENPSKGVEKYLYQGKELQQETEIYDFHARGYDPALGRTWQIDPHSENYLNLSPYSWVANNPLLFTDPTGMDIYLGNLYDKDEDGNYLYQRQILAFELFASTKTGKEFLSQRAQEGFEFKGAFVKGLEFKAEQAGDLSSKVDANFKVTDLDSYEATKDLTSGALGLTEAEITDKGKLSVTYHMHSERSDFFQKYGLKSENGAHEILNSVDTWAHETLIHGYAKEQNYFSGKYQGMTGKLSPDGGREHNLKYVRQSPYYQNTYNMLRGINSKLKLGVSDDYIWRKIIFHGYD
jgi:RHS repeat-associated protein